MLNETKVNQRKDEKDEALMPPMLDLSWIMVLLVTNPGKICSRFSKEVMTLGNIASAQEFGSTYPPVPCNWSDWSVYLWMFHSSRTPKRSRDANTRTCIFFGRWQVRSPVTALTEDIIHVCNLRLVLDVLELTKSTFGTAVRGCC